MEEPIKKNAKRTITQQLSPDDVLEILLEDRGVSDVSTYLAPPHPDTIEPSTWNTESASQDLGGLLHLLTTLHTSRQSIVIYGDFDADGITSTTIMWKALNEMGFKVFPYIPDRKSEGYGFSNKGIDFVIEKYSPGLIIALDHGIVAKEYVSYAKKKGLPVVIVDHHQKDLSLYPTEALYLFYSVDYSAAALTYFVAKLIYQHMRETGVLSTRQQTSVEQLFATDLLALAALGLIADMIPLVGGARSVAHHGLKAFSHISMPGLQTLCNISGVTRKELRSYEIGFFLAPRLNAFGRIGDALDGVRLLCAPTTALAERFGRVAQDLNKKRQLLVESALKSISQNIVLSSSFVVALGQDWEEGILGLIAGKLASQYGKPALALTTSEEGYKASGRSIAGFAITDFLRSLSVPFSSIGGHDGACGLSISLEAYPQLVDTLTKSNIEISPQPVLADLDVPFAMITHQLFEKLQKMAPFGQGNPDPLFFCESILDDTKRFGSTSQHAKYSFRDARNNFLEIIHFNAKTNVLKAREGDPYGIFFTLDEDTYGYAPSARGLYHSTVDLS